MSRFNATVKTNVPDTVNKAGGESYKLSDKQELASLVLTSFLNDKVYEKGSEQLNRIVKLSNQINDKKFLGQLAIYARDKFGMRSVSHVLAGEIAKTVKGEQWTKNFFDKIVIRLDDMSEILSYYFSVTDKKTKKHSPIPNSLKKGFSKAFGKFDSYQLSKYKGEGKSLKLIDIVNLIHPKPNKRNGFVNVNPKELVKVIKNLPVNSKTINLVKNITDIDFVKLLDESLDKDNLSADSVQVEVSTLLALSLGLLKNTDTWEAKQSKAGQNVKAKAKELNLNDSEKEELLQEEKTNNWKELIESKKIGYFALLKNLRNILESKDKELILQACELLENDNLIGKSRILPFRFLTAIKEIEKITSDSNVRKVLYSLDTALEKSLKNVPVFDGKTLVALDISGSMRSCITKTGFGSCSEIGALFTAVLLKVNPDIDLICFNDNAKYQNFNIKDSLTTLVKSLKFSSGGTDFNSIFKTANTQYDRIIILSDMQGWVNNSDNVYSFKQYRTKYNSNPFIYSFDLQGHGTSMFSAHKIALLSGFSDKVFDTMKNLEKDHKALINEIEAIEI